MYKLITSAKDTDDLSIGLDHDSVRRQRELTNNKQREGKNHVRIMPKDVFGFAEHHEKNTYGLRYNVTLTRNSGISVLNRDNAINNAKKK